MPMRGLERMAEGGHGLASMFTVLIEDFGLSLGVSFIARPLHASTYTSMNREHCAVCWFHMHCLKHTTSEYRSTMYQE